ncbi:hypothetical protein RHS01_04415 [Rhizoctonia solani]|uniref:Uncharacterized protein n=1 Tax=Rhizoctonia solani TaxID=456999 RepID=A0A8H7IGZ3_9AGAM|nr:hypothetical protein RHS01_04415 [Rhizoctonia solani]
MTPALRLGRGPLHLRTNAFQPCATASAEDTTTELNDFASNTELGLGTNGDELREWIDSLSVRFLDIATGVTILLLGDLGWVDGRLGDEVVDPSESLEAR